MNTCKTDIAMSRNTRTLEKNRFVHLVCLSLVQPLSERELCEAETSYERYVGSVQRLLVPGRCSPADTLHTLARAKMRLVRLRDAAAKVPSELLPLLDAAIELTKFEIRMIHLRVIHPDIMNAPEDARCPKSPIYLAEGSDGARCRDAGPRRRTPYRRLYGKCGDVRGSSGMAV